MTQSNRDNQTSVQDVALIVGGGPGISSSCARLFAESGMRVGVAARNPEKAVLETLEKTHGVRRYACDASEPAAVAQLFENVVQDIGTPRLVVHNIDGRVPGIFRKSVIEADPADGARDASKLSVQRVSGWSTSRQAHARKRTRRQRRERNDHLHERQRGAQRLPIKRRLCDGMSCQVRTRAKHGKRTDAAGDPRCECADRRRDRLDPGGRDPLASAGGNNCRRQHGRPRPYRENLSSASSAASVDLGVRSRAPTVGREMVTASFCQCPRGD